MRSKMLLLFALGFLLSMGALSAFAQDGESQGQLLAIHQNVVKPSMVAQYEAAAKELMAEVNKHGIGLPYIQASMTNDFHYNYIVPVENMADVETINTAFQAFADKIGQDKWQALEKKFEGTLEYEKVVLARRATDISYAPMTTTAKPEEMQFIHWDFYYLKAGMQKEAVTLANEYKALFKSKNISQGYTLYWGELGTEMPALAVVQLAKSPADFYKLGQEIRETLGQQGESLDARALAITRRIEQKDGWARPDLSYFPKADMSVK